MTYETSSSGVRRALSDPRGCARPGCGHLWSEHERHSEACYLCPCEGYVGPDDDDDEEVR